LVGTAAAAALGGAGAFAAFGAADFLGGAAFAAFAGFAAGLARRAAGLALALALVDFAFFGAAFFALFLDVLRLVVFLAAMVFPSRYETGAKKTRNGAPATSLKIGARPSTQCVGGDAPGARWSGVSPR
jgi:hypothetical protein